MMQAGPMSSVSISKSQVGFSFSLFPWISIDDSSSTHSLKLLVRLEQSLASTPCNLAR